MRKLVITFLALVVFAVLFVVLCTFRVRPYENVVLDRFGQVIDKPAKICYGWYLCYPTDKVVRMDNRLHIYQSTLQQLATRRGDSISVRAFAAWQISDPHKFYRTLKGSDETAQNRLNDMITSKVQAVFGQYDLENIFNTDTDKLKTQEMETWVTTAVNTGIENNLGSEKGLAAESIHGTEKDFGIKIVQIGFSRIAFPPRVASAVYERMTSERNRQANKFISEGQSEATRIRAEGDRDASKLRVDAERDAQAIRGEGDAQALRILSESQTPEKRDFYRFWKDLELFKNTIGKGSIIILRTDETVADQLFKPGQSPALKISEKK